MKSSKQYNLKGAVRNLGPAQFLDVRGRVISSRDPDGKARKEVYDPRLDLYRKVAD
jgi:hypothetical protein